MQISKVFLLIFIMLTVAVAGCSLVETKHVSNPNVDVSQFETYSWVTTPIEADGSDLYRFDNAMRRELTASLNDKGYRQVQEGADMLLDFRLGVRPEEVDSESRLPPQGLEFERNSNTNVDLNPAMEANPEVVSYSRGEIVVTFYSPDQQQRYWEGSVSEVTEKVVGESADELEANVPDYVSRILSKFPAH